ncbi:unnamed protein product [Ixodes pacificus]
MCLFKVCGLFSQPRSPHFQDFARPIFVTLNEAICEMPFKAMKNLLLWINRTPKV